MPDDSQREPTASLKNARILVVRTSALGDIVHCLPVLTTLRRHLPEARLGWVVEESMAPLLADHPDLDERLVVRLRTWRKRSFAPSTVREIAGFLAALDRFAPDVVLDLMGNHKGGILAAATLADRRLGLAARWRREPSSAVWISEGLEPRGPHAVDRALAVLAGLGLPTDEVDFGGDKLLRPEPPAAGPSNGSAAADVILIPGAAWSNKVYPPELWGLVGRQLAERGLRVASAPGRGEEELARRAAEASDGAIEALAPTDLPALARLFRAADLVIGGDTGPLHLAQALGREVLAVMGPTDPVAHGPYGLPDRALWVRLPCSFCHKRLVGARPCLLAIPPERIARRALEILEE